MGQKGCTKCLTPKGLSVAYLCAITRQKDGKKRHEYM
nr:MAG TPA: hypothetical protein [Caudoviricetes sp.]